MVYHIRTNDFGVLLPSERILAFVWGFQSHQIEDILDFRHSQQLDIPADHLTWTLKMTPEQVLARVLHEQDEVMSAELVTMSERLSMPATHWTEELLIHENEILWAIRSIIHRLNGVIDHLLNPFDPFTVSARERFEAQKDPTMDETLLVLYNLDIIKRYGWMQETLKAIRKSMEQDRADAQILQEHINLNISKVGFCSKHIYGATTSPSNLFYVGTERQRRGGSSGPDSYRYKHSSGWLRYESYRNSDGIVFAWNFHGCIFNLVTNIRVNC